MNTRTLARMFERDGLPELAERHPVNRAMSSIVGHESEAVRLLRINGPRARRLCEEMERDQ